MAYFQSFPSALYKYGDGSSFTFTENLAAYAEVFDSIKDNSAFYQDYYVNIGERPDHAAYVLYQNPQLHWTFFLMNPKLRERGWPESQSNVLKKSKEDYPNITLTARDEIFNTFSVGQEIQGQISMATGVVIKKNLDLGQVVIKTTLGTFKVDGEQVNSTVGEDIQIMQTVSAGPEHLSAKYYMDNNEPVSINPYVGPDPLLSEVTYYDHYIAENEELKQIRALKPENVRSVTRAFRDAMES